MNHSGSGASGAGAMTCVNSAFVVINTDVQDLPALPAAAAEDKAVIREKAMISKKLKYDQRMYSSLVNQLAKCRNSILLGEVDVQCTPLLNTLEKECPQFQAMLQIAKPKVPRVDDAEMAG